MWRLFHFYPSDAKENTHTYTQVDFVLAIYDLYIATSINKCVFSEHECLRVDYPSFLDSL